MIQFIWLVGTVFCVVYADVKTWIGPNTDFPRVLSPGSRVHFDVAYDFPILLKERTRYNVCEVILPNEGEIIFASDFSLTLGAQRECTQTEVFSVKNRAFWLDPKNWDSSYTNLATPDLERLPCAGDTVRFSSDSVYLYTPDVLIHKLIINGQTFVQDSLNDFLWSETGTKMFALDPYTRPLVQSDRPVIMLTPACDLQGGCVCMYHSQAEVDEGHMCHVVREACEKEPPCMTPILPYGACCPICGAQILLNRTDPSQFNLGLLRTKVSRIVSQFSAQYKPVDAFVSRSFYDTIQVVLVEHGEYEGYVEQLAEMVKQMVKTDPSLHVTLYHNVFHSGYPYNPHGGVSGFQIFLLTCCLSLGVLGALYIHYYHDGWSFLGLDNIRAGSLLGFGRTHVDSAFVFQRFDNEGKKNPVVYEVTPRVPAKSFDNPMYNVDPKETIDPADTPTAQSFQELKEKYEDEMDED